jgi:hypothetical protein
MKKTRHYVMMKVFFSILTAILVLVAYNYFHKNNSKLIQVQGVDLVDSVQLIPPHAGASDMVIVLDAQRTKDKQVISKIIRQLHEAKLVGQASNQFTSIGGSPTSLVIKYRNGDVLQIVDAVGAVAQKLENGSTEVRPDSIPNQVTVYQNSKAWRIVSPELKVWTETDWSKDVGDFKNHSTYD